MLTDGDEAVLGIKNYSHRWVLSWSVWLHFCRLSFLLLKAALLLFPSLLTELFIKWNFPLHPIFATSIHSASQLTVNHRQLNALPSDVQLKSHRCILCKFLPEYSLAECGADGCNRFSISRSLVVRFLVWRNKNSVQTIAMTATHSVDLREEKRKCEIAPSKLRVKVQR